MNRDVKIGLAIGLLLLVGLFIWFAWKASRGQPTVADITKKEAEKTIGPDKTSSTDTGDVATAKDYFGEDCGTTPAATAKDTATFEVGKGDKPKDDLTAEARKYLELLKKNTPGTGPVTSFETKGTTGMTGPTDTGFSSTPQTYVVKRGDYLSTISKKVYGSARFWDKIAQANNISDAKSLRQGMTLKIPALSDDERAKISGKATGPTATAFTPGAGEQIHKVVAGDTLEAISKKYYGTIRHAKLIMEANKLENDRMLRVGSTLVIPKLPAVVSPAGPATVVSIPPAPAVDAKKEYVVQGGDTLTSISKKFYGSSRFYLLIMQANNLDDARSVRIGTKLTIPPKPTADIAPAAVPIEASAPAMAPGEKAYTVREGDTFAIVAASELGSSLYSNDVMKRNSLTEADTLRPGQVLVLPARASLHVLSSVTREE